MNKCPYQLTVENDIRKLEVGDPHTTLLIPGREHDHRCRLCYDLHTEGHDKNCEIWKDYAGVEV